MNKTTTALLFLIGTVLFATGCEWNQNDSLQKKTGTRNEAQMPPSVVEQAKFAAQKPTQSNIGGSKTEEIKKTEMPSSKPGPVSSIINDTAPKPTTPNKQEMAKPAQTPIQPAKNQAIQVVANASSITVLINKQHSLPKNYAPADLVVPKVPFLASASAEKRKMRKEAAAALEQMFAAAKKGGISLAGVSAYRSHLTQKSLFAYYAKRDGEAKARTYSAVEGTSEHETGLAIDVAGINGKCPATDCFADTPEAKWLAQHAAEYGFIIRYPKGKEAITGYQYEPWHLRYLGVQVAKEIHAKGITLEEYMTALPVEKKQ